MAKRRTLSVALEPSSQFLAGLSLPSRRAASSESANFPITLRRFWEPAHLFGKLEELVPFAILGYEGVEHHGGERVESVGETGFALNQKLHDLTAQACLFRMLLFEAAQVYSTI
jgi:hypothetical protein